MVVLELRAEVNPDHLWDFRPRQPRRISIQKRRCSTCCEQAGSLHGRPPVRWRDSKRQQSFRNAVRAVRTGLLGDLIIDAGRVELWGLPQRL